MKRSLVIPLFIGLFLLLGQTSRIAAADKGGDEQGGARAKWLDEQVLFIEKLGGIGYDDLAKKVKRDTLKGIGSPDNKPLNADEKKNLDRAEAMAKLELALRMTDLKKKILVGDQAVKAMKGVVTALKRNPADLLKAQKSLAEMYFRLGNTMTDEYEKSDKKGGNAQKQELQRLISEVDKKMKPVQEQIAKLKKEYNDLLKKAGKKENKANKKKLLADAKAKNAEVKKLDESLKPMREEKVKLQKVIDNIVDAAVLAKKGREYFAAGIVLGRIVAKAFDDDFWNKMGLLDEPENSRGRARAAAMKKIQASFSRKVNFSHKLESAYASQLILYPRGSKQQLDLIKKGLEYIDMVTGDYDTYYPKDKGAYLQWIRILSHMNDDLDKPQKEDETDMDKDELAQALIDPTHYLWPTLRMRFIWDYQYTTKLDKIKPKEIKKQMSWYRPTPSAQVRGLYYYTNCLLRSARGHFELADKMPDPTKKKRMMQHAGELMKECEKWLAEVVKPVCVFGKVPESVRLTARLKIESKLHLLRAERLAKVNRKDDAKKEVKAAIAAVTKVLVEGGSKWRHVVQARIRLVKINGERIAGKIEIDKGNVIPILAEADTLYVKAVKAGSAARKRDLFSKAMHRYLDAFAVMKSYRERKQRASWMPRTMFRIGICAWQAREFLTGYFINFALAREFGGPHYPAGMYPQAVEYARRALGNLHACAGKVLDEDEKNPSLRKLYAEQLYLRMARDPNPDPRLVLKLIDTLKNLRMYDDALALIDDVPTDHLYYRMALLMAADIHQTMMKRAQKVGDKIRKRAQKKERELTEAEKKLIAAQQPAIDEHSAAAEKYATIFREEVGKRPAPTTEEQKKVYAMEDAAIPGALMIPISNQFARKEYAKALEGVDDYIARVSKLGNLKPEARHRYIATARWIKLLCTYYKVDHKTAPVPEVFAAIDEAEKKLLPALEQEEKLANEAEAKVKPDSGKEGESAASPVKREDFATKAYMQLGSGWNSLANRVFNERKDENNTLKPADQKLYDDYRRRAAGFFGRAGKIAYTKRSIGMLIGKTYYELGMYREAADMYDKVIKFWSESLFTPDYIFKAGKSLKDLKTFSIPGAIKSQLGEVVDPGEITGAGDEAALLKALNKFVVGIRYAPNKEKIDKILKEARAAYADDRGLQRLLDQAAMLTKRDDLAKNLEVRQKLNRIILEAIFPTVLARSKPMPLIPSEKGFVKATKGVWSVYPPTREGQIKKNVLKFMHDQGLVRLAKDKKILADYQKQLKERMNAALKKGDRKTAQKIGGYLWLFEKGLRRYVYGVRKKGQVVERSYYRARQQLGGIINFDKNELHLEQPKYMPTNVHKASFLMNLGNALTFHSSVLSAKRRYALALVKLGKNDKALRYLKELVRFWPGETDLKLDLAEVYASIGDNLAKTKYTQKSADYFIYAQHEALQVKKKAKDFSRLWWQCQKSIAYAQTLEVLARTRCKAMDVNYQTEVMVMWRGKLHKVKKQTPRYLVTPSTKGTSGELGQADKLVRNLSALLSLKPPEDLVEYFEDMLSDLAEKGYKPPEQKKEKSTPAKDKQEKVADEPGGEKEKKKAGTKKNGNE